MAKIIFPLLFVFLWSDAFIARPLLIELSQRLVYTMTFPPIMRLSGLLQAVVQ